MKKLYTNHEYVERLVTISRYYQTYYAWGAFGAPASYKNKVRYKVPQTLPTDTFLFDCSGFAYKALPWGWCGDESRTYGGATYKAIPELETNNILSICTNVSSDFSQIAEGEILYMKGHVGVYIGNGKCIECTSKWEGGVLISEVTNTKIKTGLEHKRKWISHGMLPFINYTDLDVAKNDSYMKYVVKKGDTLGKIARTYLGSFGRYVEIMEINKLISTVIHPNQILWIPKETTEYEEK